MKKIIFSSMVFLLFPVMSHGAGYVLATYGSGGEVDGPSYGLEMGGIFLSPYHPAGGAFSVGLGISVADTDEDPPDRITKTYNDGNEQEVHATFGAEITPAFFGVAGIGYASQDTVQPDGLGGKDSETDSHASWLLGVRYVMEWFNIGVGYHNRRGVMAGLGIAF